MQSPPTPFHKARKRSIQRYPDEFLAARIGVINMMIGLGFGRLRSRHDFGTLCHQRALCARELRRRGTLPAHMDRFGRPEDVRTGGEGSNKDRNGR